MYQIYIITNIINAKQYVGITNNLERRFADHRRADRKNSVLHQAIHLHGIDNFIFSHIASAFNLDCAYSIEKMLIIEHNTKAPFGYNLTDGGDGIVGLTEDSKKRMSRLGSKHSEETKKKISKSGLGKVRARDSVQRGAEKRKGRAVSKEQRDKISQKLMGRKIPPEVIAKRSGSIKGVCRGPMSEERKRNISLAKLGKEPSNKGGFHTEKAKAKMKAAWVIRKAKHSSEAGVIT